MKIISYFLPLVKHIKSKDGKDHFKRWRILELPFFRVYLHQILRSDEDDYLHTHPWHFTSIVLKGFYWEVLKISGGMVHRFRDRWSISYHHRAVPHQITLDGGPNNSRPAWTLVLAYGFKHDWGFDTPDGLISNDEYRKLKHREV